MKDARALRIVFYEPAGRGGICHYTWELAEHLALAGHDVTVWTTAGYELANYPRHFRVRRLFRASLLKRALRAVSARKESAGSPAGAPAGGRGQAGGFFGRLRRLRLRLLHARAVATLLLRRPDIVHFQWLADPEIDVALMRTLRAAGILVVYTAHDVLLRERNDTERERTVRSRLYRAPDRIVVHSEADRRELAEAFGVARENVSVVPHGAYDFRFGSGGTVEAGEARRRLGIPRERKVVLFFGLIKRYKGLGYLISAFDLVASRRDDAFLLIVGDAPRFDADRAEMDRIAALGTRENVRAVIGYVPIEDIPVYFAAADVVVLPYTEISQSGVLLSAYGAGRPVVATAVGGLPETVEEGGTGRVVAPRDAEAIADAVLDILSDPERARAMGRRARELSATAYSWESIARRTAQTYAEAGRRAGRLRAKTRHRLRASESWTGPGG